ncbi:hypothetical protein [Halorubrum sp. BOL3-1]|nr:hypothetical protein [Halorubrum sp. BOL3-1]
MSILDRLFGTNSDDESCCEVQIEEIDAENDDESTSERTATEYQ